MAVSDNVSNADIFEILKEIKAGNEQIRTDIKQIKEDLFQQTDKIRELNARIDTLEYKNKELQQKLRDTQRKTRKNNLVIFGIPENEDAKTYLITILKEKLQVELEETDIDNIYRVGQIIKENKPRPLILELVRNTKKQEIFQNVSKLKGSRISITNDLTQEEREEHKVLYKHLKLAKEKQYQAKIIKNKLVVNGESFTYEQLKYKDEEAENTAVIRYKFLESHSAPNTPTTEKYTSVNSTESNTNTENEEDSELGSQIENTKTEKNKKIENKQISYQESSFKTIITRSNKKSSDTDLTSPHPKKNKKIN